jgi:hypothetical protein
MKSLLVCVVASALSACSLLDYKVKSPEEKKEPEDPATRVKTLELKMDSRDENHRLALEQLLKQDQDQIQRAGKLEQRLTLLEATVGRLQEQVASAPAIRPISPAPEAAARPPSPPPPPPRAGSVPAGADRAARMTEIASVLKDPAFNDVERLQQELRPYAAEAAAFLLQEIKRAPTDSALMARAEQIIRGFPPEEVRGPLGRALEDPLLRLLATQIISHLADPAYADLLHRFTTEPDPSFQLAVGVALVRCADKAGIPFLIAGLRAEQKANRILAIQTLKSINRRETYGYDWQLPPAANAQPIRDWESWWEAFKDYDLLH